MDWGKSIEIIHRSRVKGKRANTLHTSKFFDCLEWWERFVRRDLLYYVIIVAVPAENIHQERTIRAYTWLNDPHILAKDRQSLQGTGPAHCQGGSPKRFIYSFVVYKKFTIILSRKYSIYQLIELIM